MITIYHNTLCSKSREACTLLQSSTKKFKIVEYLQNPPTKEELKDLIKKLGIEPEELVRKKEPIFLTLYKNKRLSSSQWISVMAKHPILIERPIVVFRNQAIICRPPEKLLEFLK